MSQATESETPMGWKLFLVDRDLSNDEIASAFAEIFEIGRDDLLVIGAIESLEEDLSKNVLIICEQAPVKGDFKISLKIHLQNDEFDEGVEFVESFCKILACNCLILDPDKEDLNDEDACLFIQGLEGYIEEVYLDPGSLNRDEYTILKSDVLEDEKFISVDPNQNLNTPKKTRDSSKIQNEKLFNLIDIDRYYFLYEYQGKIIHLPKDVATGNDGSILTVLSISQATYKDTNELLSANDSELLKSFLVEETRIEGITIVVE